MLQKLFFITMLFISTISFGQKKKSKFYVAGNTNNLPNIQLYLNKDNTYKLKLFGTDCWGWQFLDGKCHYEKDSLVLVYDTYYPEPLCQIIDTFGRQRTLNLLYLNNKNIVDDTLSIDLDHDTTNVDHFPLDYIDSTIVDRKKSSITFTYYAPYFDSKSLDIKFYKPKKKIAKTYFIKFKVDKNYLIISKQFVDLFKPFDRLKLE